MTENEQKQIKTWQENLKKLKWKLNDLKLTENVRRSVALIVNKNWMR